MGELTDEELKFDHSNPAMGPRLHETYSEFRAKCPVARGEKFGGFWALTRYDDVLKATRDHANFTVTQGITIPHINGDTPVLPAQVDPPEHTAYRRIVQKFFTPTAMQPYDEILRGLARKQLATIAGAGAADLLQVLGGPIPPAAIALMFGLPIEESLRFVEWADRMMETAPCPDPTRPEAATDRRSVGYPRNGGGGAALRGAGDEHGPHGREGDRTRWAPVLRWRSSAAGVHLRQPGRSRV
jgi:cytochrome P450